MKTWDIVSGFSPYGFLFRYMFNEFATKQSSEQTYRYIVPIIKDKIYSGATMKDTEIQEAAALLHSLAPYGAKKSNFSRRYLVDERTMLDLPDDPDRLSPGYWW